MQQKECEHAIQQKEDWMKTFLHEKEEEMKLALEERDLQKMAALSQQDSAKDQLEEQLHSVQSVSTLLFMTHNNGQLPWFW